MAVVLAVGTVTSPNLSNCQQAIPSQQISPSADIGRRQSRIRGSVVDQVTNGRLAGVHIRLIPIQSISQRSVDTVYGAVTSEAGVFVFKDMPAGAYFVTAETNGFELLPLREKGAPRDNVLFVTLDQDKHVTLEMARRAVLTGRVIDRNNEPVPDATVQVTAASNDYRLSSAARQTITDDNGDFRLSVAPGRYYLRARIGGGPATEESHEIRTDGTTDITYRDTYFPGVINADAAAPIDAKAGARIGNLDIRLVAAPVRLSITGVVTGIPDGVKSFGVTLESGNSPDEIHQGVTRGFSVAAGSSVQAFSFSELQPAYYRIYATSGTGDGQLESQVEELRLEDSAVADTNLVLTPGFSLHGSLEVFKGPGARERTVGRAVTLASIRSTMEQAPRTGEVSSTGLFRIGGLRRERYRVIVKPIQDNEYVKTVRLGATEFAGDVIDLRNWASDAKLVVVVSDGGAEISGQITAGSAPVSSTLVLVADQSEIARSDLRYAFAGLDGKYRFHGIPPGKYRLFNFDLSSSPDDQFKIIRAQLGGGRLVELHERDKRSEDFAVGRKETADDGTRP